MCCGSQIEKSCGDCSVDSCGGDCHLLPTGQCVQKDCDQKELFGDEYCNGKTNVQGK